jgi:hypothetical protein
LAPSHRFLPFLERTVRATNLKGCGCKNHRDEHNNKMSFVKNEGIGDLDTRAKPARNHRANLHLIGSFELGLEQTAVSVTPMILFISPRKIKVLSISRLHSAALPKSQNSRIPREIRRPYSRSSVFV